MDGFNTFPTRNPPPSARMAAARVAGQDRMLMDAAGAAYQHIIDSTAVQEDVLKSVYKPVIADAGRRVAEQGAVLDGLLSHVGLQLGAKLATQQAVSDNLLSSVGTDIIDTGGTPAPAPTPTAPYWNQCVPGGASGSISNGYPGMTVNGDGTVTLPDGTRAPVLSVGLGQVVYQCLTGAAPPPAAPPTTPPPPPTVPVSPPAPCSIPAGSVPWNVFPDSCRLPDIALPLSLYAALEHQYKNFNVCDWLASNPGQSLPQLPYVDVNGNNMLYDLNTGQVLPGQNVLFPPGTVTGIPTDFPAPCPPPAVPPPPPPWPTSPPPAVPPPGVCCPSPPVVIQVPCPSSPPAAPPPVSPPALPPPPPGTCGPRFGQTPPGAARVADRAPTGSCPTPPAAVGWVGGAWCDPAKYRSIAAEMAPAAPPITTALSIFPDPWGWVTSFGERLWDEIFGPTGAGGATVTGSIASHRVSQAIASWAGRVTGADIEYHATGDKYTAQYLDPQFIPTRDNLIDLYHKGKLDNRDQYDALCRANGHCSFYSLAMLDAAQPRLGLPELVSLNMRGFLADDKLYSEAAKIGYADRFYIDHAWNLNVFQFDALDTVKLWWRGIIDTPQRDELLKFQGLVSDRVRDRWVNLQTFLPPPSDAIRLSIKDVFDPNDLGRAERVAEFNQQVGLREMLAATGIVPMTIKGFDGTPIYIDTPLFYWLASYEEVSPQQGEEMYHRLRPNRVTRYPLTNPDGSVTYPEPVELPLLRRLFKEKDYNPIWRDRLAAISSATIGRIDLRRVYGSGGFGRPLYTKGYEYRGDQPVSATGPAEVELYERYRDDKYVPDDAILLAWFTSYDIEETRKSGTRTRRLGSICRAYKLGAIDRNRAEQQFALTVRYGEDAARYAALCEAELANDLLASAVAGIKRQFIAGELSERQTRQALARTGVQAGMIDRYVLNWQNNRIGKRRYETAQQIVTWYLEGLLTRQEATDRLQNIGFDAGNAFRIIRHGEMGALARSAKDQARIAAATQRAIEKQQRIAKQEADAAEKLQEKVLARFLSARTVKNLTDWLKDGTITDADVYNTFALSGKSRDDAARVIAHARKPAAPKSSGGKSGGGQPGG